MPRDSFAARVRRGVEFLDNTVNDDWHLKIDLDSLNLADGAHCVLGQLWQGKLGDDYSPDEAYDVATGELSLGPHMERSFNIGEGESWTAYRWLTLRWKQAIRERTNAT